jgi:hypothetical protein
MLEKNPSKRIKAEDILSDMYFQNNEDKLKML